jgi:hypothetical protein
MIKVMRMAATKAILSAIAALFLMSCSDPQPLDLARTDDNVNYFGAPGCKIDCGEWSSLSPGIRGD